MDIIVLVTTLVVILVTLYKWITNNNKYFDKLNVKHLKPHFMLGNTGGLYFGRYRGDEFSKILYNAFPTEKIYGMFEFKTPIYVVRDPEILKKLTVKDFDYFVNHKPFVDPSTDPLFANSLFLLSGDKWREMRTTLSPAFTGSKMRQMFVLLSKCASDMAIYFQSEYENNKNDRSYTIDLDLKEAFSRYTTDVIATCAFGIEVNSFKQKDNEFFTTGKDALNFSSISTIVKFLLIRVLPSVTRALDLSIISKKVNNFFKSMVIDTMAIREKNNIFRPDMINILMQVKKGNLAINQNEEKENLDGFSTVTEESINGIKKTTAWTNEELVAQCFLFFFAGFDTSSTLLSFLAYELAVNVDVQQKLYEEILFNNELLNGKNITYDALHKMEYLDMVISETLRKWPPAMLTDRVCVKDYLYDDGERKFKIEKDLQIWIPVYGFHHDPEYFPNPDQFDPERFNEINKHSINPGSYLPFGIGPRNCIGSRFALMQIKAVIYNLLLHFNFVPNKLTQIPLRLKKGLGDTVPEKRINITLKPRGKV